MRSLVLAAVCNWLMCMETTENKLMAVWNPLLSHIPRVCSAGVCNLFFPSLCKFAWSKLTPFCTSSCFSFFTTSRTPFIAWSSSATFECLVFLLHYVWAIFAFIGSFQIERDSKHGWILIQDGTFLNQIKPHPSAFNLSFTYLLLALLVVSGLQSG